MRWPTLAILLAGAIIVSFFSAAPGTWGCSRNHLPPFEVHGHRGAAGELPPGNLLPSFLRAIADGATTLEGDLRLTRDEELVFNHDSRLSEQCRPDRPLATRHVDELSLEQVLRHDCDASKAGVQPPAALEHVLELHEDGSFGFNLEIKPKGLHAARVVLSALDEYNQSCAGCLKDRILLQSFHLEHLSYLREKIGKRGREEARYRTSFLTDAPNLDELMRVAELADVYSPRFGDALNQSLIETAHRQRMRVIPWTVNEPHEICEVARMGADGVITDFPARAKETAALVATLGRRPKKCP